MTAVVASGFTLYRGDSRAVFVVGPTGRPDHEHNTTITSSKISNHSFRDACFRLNTKASSKNDVQLHLQCLVGSECARNRKSRGLPCNKFRTLN
jgi:hypothetical protein